MMLVFQYCSKDGASAPVVVTVANSPGLPAQTYSYAISYPAHINTALTNNDNTPVDNTITDDGATLGRVLFYDKKLSVNNTVSCSSCHQQALSFSDTALRSVGFGGGLTKRHSMPLLNVRFYKSGKMFWDERAATLEDQTLMPIQDLTEMGMTLTSLVTKLDTISYYPALFQKAFGSTAISSEKISKALSQFVRSIVTSQSKYDRVKQGLATFTTDESAGERLFLTAGVNTCASCHAPPMFLTSTPKLGFALADLDDRGINNENRFKAGSLRNIALTAPYFHNGSIKSLQEMLGARIPDHSVAPPDIPQLLAFLQTLSDESITAELKFADPFK